MADVENLRPAESRGHQPDEGSKRGRRLTIALTLLGILIAAASLGRDYLDLTKREPNSDPSASASRTTVTAPAQTAGDRGSVDQEITGEPAGVQGTPNGVHLDTLEVQGGKDNLVDLPRALRGQPGYQRPITITCPRNTSADKYREVTYPLLGRYVDLTTVIRPYFPDDSQAKAYVSVITSTKQEDDTVNRLDRGGKATRQGAPVQLSVDVEKTDELAIRVQCESPTGLVVLTETLLTPR
ncbi:hypothetical protein [Micromonospora sp.]|uniref:hypothetical protein n=1 Tax=unclassified Micromonospora TaxID=2617518 RepID=UPI003B3B9ED7